MEHPWILEFSQQIANEMNLHSGGNDEPSPHHRVETIAEEDEDAEQADDARQDGYYQHLAGDLEGTATPMASTHFTGAQDDIEAVEQFKDVEAVDGKTAGAHGGDNSPDVLQSQS